MGMMPPNPGYVRKNSARVQRVYARVRGESTPDCSMLWASAKPLGTQIFQVRK